MTKMNLYNVTWLHNDGSIKVTMVAAINESKAGSSIFMSIEDCSDILKVTEA